MIILSATESKQYVTSDRVIGNNDIITIDLSPQVGNIWGDYARTIIVENGMVVENIGLIENPEWKSGLQMEEAYIMNMYTAPEYRRQGIAIHTLDLLVKDAKEQGVLQIALEATDMGRPLYERYGFVKMEDEMELI